MESFSGGGGLWLECQCQHLHHILIIGVAIHFWRDSLGLFRNISNLIRVMSLATSQHWL